MSGNYWWSAWEWNASVTVWCLFGVNLTNLPVQQTVALLVIWQALTLIWRNSKKNVSFDDISFWVAEFDQSQTSSQCWAHDVYQKVGLGRGGRRNFASLPKVYYMMISYISVFLALCKWNPMVTTYCRWGYDISKSNVDIKSNIYANTEAISGENQPRLNSVTINLNCCAFRRKSLLLMGACPIPLWWMVINSLRPRPNRRHIADDIFKCIFLNENAWIPIKISLKFVPKGPINNIPALVQIMAWRRSGDKPLSEPMMVNLPTHICVTRPQWVKLLGRWKITWYFPAIKRFGFIWLWLRVKF